MTLRNPTYEQIMKIASEFGFALDDCDHGEMMGVVNGMMDSYRRLDGLPNPYRESKYARTSGYKPEPQDNRLNAWAWRCSAKGRDEGLLKGKTVALKDNICMSGIPTMNGTRVLEGFIPREDATVVTRVLDAGGEIIGKAVCESFCFSGGSHTSDPLPVLNPHDNSKMAGGSSSGCAALLAAGDVDLALGGDQGGSVRMPGSWSGVVGLKATHGLVPYTGIFPIEGSLDHVAPMARTVSDVALLLQAVAGPDGLDPRQVDVTVGDFLGAADRDCAGLRVAIVKEGFEWEGRSDPAVNALVRKTADALKELGATVNEISIPEHKDGVHIWNGIAIEGATAHMVVGNGFAWNRKGHYDLDLIDFYSNARLHNAADFPMTVKLVALVGQYLTNQYGGHYYAKSQNLGRQLGGRYDAALADYDVLLMPTTPMTAMGHDVNKGLSGYMEGALGMIHNTCPFDFTGHPAISVPCGKIDNMPVGLMLVGRRFDEETVIRLARGVEKVTNG
jgi:amidase